MTSFLLAVAITILTACVPAGAAPPPCEQISAMLADGSDPADVAAELGTTRARVNACAKLDDSLEQLAERRAELHRERRERGLD